MQNALNSIWNKQCLTIGWLWKFLFSLKDYLLFVMKCIVLNINLVCTIHSDCVSGQSPPAIKFMQRLYNMLFELHRSIASNNNWIPSLLLGITHPRMASVCLMQQNFSQCKNYVYCFCLGTTINWLKIFKSVSSVLFSTTWTLMLYFSNTVAFV